MLHAMPFSELQSLNYSSVTAGSASTAVLLAPCADWRFCSAVLSRFMSWFAVKHPPSSPCQEADNFELEGG